MGHINTVGGPISSEDMGITLPHEHLLIDMTCWFVEAKEPSLSYLADSPIAIDMLGDLRRNANCSLHNLKLTDAGDAIKELTIFRKCGGKTLVDVTVEGIGRDPLALKEISLATGVNIIVGSGWYFEGARPDYIRRTTVDDLANILLKDLTFGIGVTEVRAGVIGEIGFAYLLTDTDRKILKACAKAQRESEASLTIHPATENDEHKRRIRQVTDYLDILAAEDTNLEKVYLSHSDFFIYDLDYLRRIVDSYNITIEFDQFIVSTYMDNIWPGYGPPDDDEKVKAIVTLIESGYDRKIMLSQDICMKHHLVKYGGYGYAHILKHIIPMLRYRGIGEKEISRMLLENPREMLELPGGVAQG